MGSPTRDNATGGALFSLDFAETGGCSRRETEECYPPVSNVSDDLLPFLAPAHLPPQASEVPEAIVPVPLPGSGKLDKLYEPYFRRLDLELEVLKAKHLVPELPKVLQGNMSAQIHVPSSVTQGCVPVLDVLDVRDVEADGGVVFGSVLVEREAGVGK